MKEWEIVRDDIEQKVLPTIHDMMAKGDPLLYIRYGGRCCKQVTFLLTRYLQERLPDYHWTAWESTFTDYMEDYPHAWVYGESKTEQSDLILDYGKLQTEYAFFQESNGNVYPTLLDSKDNRFFTTEEELELDMEIEDERKQIVPPEDVLMAFVGMTFGEAYQTLQKKLEEAGQ